MKKLFLPLLIILLLGASCSSGKKGSAAPAGDQANTEKPSDDFVVDSDAEDLFLDESDGQPPAEVAQEQPAQEQPVEIVDEPINEVQEAPVIANGECQNAAYEVKSGETLMQIAFNLYGDYKKWKEIAGMNSGINVESLKAGTALNYCTGSELSWKPNGNPHVIRLGETLGKISDDKYKTVKRWKEIWHNNKPLIQDPNKIYAGFTIYYIPDERVAEM